MTRTYIVEVHNTDPIDGENGLLFLYKFRGTEEQAYEDGWQHANDCPCPTEVYVKEES